VAFKKRTTRPPVPDRPEALYPILSHGADAPRELWSRQADVLRAYDRLKDKDGKFPADVAIELPTGAGKTLVGCLIAEWRRRKYEETVAYVAPTQGRLYGIRAVDLTGSHTRWDTADEITFRQGDAVAFVTYSAVFNANPYITAKTIVLDDAHAAEGYVAANWSIRIRRGDRAFPVVLDVLADAGAVPADVIRRLRLDDLDDLDDADDEEISAAVYLAGIAETAAAAGDLEQVLDDAAAQGGIPRESQFALDMVRGSLPACMIYISGRELLIRPLIAPTRFHDAFGDARHRVYMSATLGDGGELERAFGRRKITRIPVPANWETQGTGRRFFVFPDLLRGLGDKERIAAFTIRVLDLFGKAVLIAPSDRAKKRLAAAVVPELMPMWQPEEFAEAPEEFAEAPGGVLALANRYDGIDLPDEACRLVILAGLPVGMHLQERFLHESVRALAVLTERIRTRLTQGAGRATRNSADYAAVIMLGRDLANFCAEPGVQAASHPEIRAEICFGLDNSQGIQAREAMRNLRHFHGQDEDWRAAEQDIIASREEVARTRPPGTGQLAAAAPHEVAAMDAAWQGDWPAAIDAAGKALGELAGDDVRHYQALWHYILASWAVIAARAGDPNRWQTVAETHFTDARAAAAGTRWLTGLTTSTSLLITPRNRDTVDPIDAAAISGIAASPLRTAPAKKFAALTETVTTGLAQVSAAPYERALAGLGELAGAAVPQRTGADAEPDSMWMIGPHLWAGFEAKTECDPEGEVSADAARQAGGHINYAASNTGTAPPPSSFAVIISPQDRVHRAAVAVAGDRVYLAPPDVITEIANRLTSAWDSIRIRTRAMGPAEAEPVIAEILRARRALPSQWLPALTARRIADG
jgi:Helicase C-terminal domain